MKYSMKDLILICLIVMLGTIVVVQNLHEAPDPVPEPPCCLQIPRSIRIDPLQSPWMDESALSAVCSQHP